MDPVKLPTFQQHHGPSRCPSKPRLSPPALRRFLSPCFLVGGAGLGDTHSLQTRAWDNTVPSMAAMVSEVLSPGHRKLQPLPGGSLRFPSSLRPATLRGKGLRGC